MCLWIIAGILVLKQACLLATLCGRRGKRQDVGVIALDPRKARQYGTSALKPQKAQSEVLGGPTYFITFISCPLSLPTCTHFCPHNPQATAPTQDALLHPPQALCTCACTHGAAKLPDTAVQAGHHTGCCFHTADITGVYQQSLAGGRKMHLLSFNHLYVGAIWASRALCLLCLIIAFPMLHASRSCLWLHHLSLFSWKISIATPFSPHPADVSQC